MMRLFFDAAFAFVTLGTIEAVIKPIAKRFVQGRILRYAPAVFDIIDPLMSSMMKQHNGQEIDDIVRGHFERITGESWADVNLAPFWAMYDPRKAADKHQS